MASGSGPLFMESPGELCADVSPPNAQGASGDEAGRAGADSLVAPGAAQSDEEAGASQGQHPGHFPIIYFLLQDTGCGWHILSPN